jgi:hypothetical protein
MSRPTKPYSTHLAITAIRMPPQTKAKLEALSHQSGLAQQEHIRRALDDYFDDLVEKGKFDPSSRRPANAPRRGRPPGSFAKAQPQPQAAPGPTRRIFRRPGSSGMSASV